jgi:hypothetical protein
MIHLCTQDYWDPMLPRLLSPWPMCTEIKGLTRWLLDNAHHEGLRVSGSLHVGTRHRILDKREARFTQVRSPRRGNTLTPCLSDFDYEWNRLQWDSRRTAWWCSRREVTWLGFGVCMKGWERDPTTLSWHLYRRLGPESPTRIRLQYIYIPPNLPILECFLAL